MSSAHDAHGAAAPAHAHDDHDAFDGEPADDLSPGESPSPTWLPLLGLALFTCAAIYAVGSGDPAASVTAAKPVPAEPPPAAAPAAPAGTPAPRFTAVPQQAPPPPSAPAGSALRKLEPGQVEELKKRIEQARAKGMLPGTAAKPVAPAGK